MGLVLGLGLGLYLCKGWVGVWLRARVDIGIRQGRRWERRVHIDVNYRRRVGNDLPVGGLGVTHRWGVGNTSSAVAYQNV